jgi:hypothetical protein
VLCICIYTLFSGSDEMHYDLSTSCLLGSVGMYLSTYITGCWFLILSQCTEWVENQHPLVSVVLVPGLELHFSFRSYRTNQYFCQLKFPSLKRDIFQKHGYLSRCKMDNRMIPKSLLVPDLIKMLPNPTLMNFYITTPRYSYSTKSNTSPPLTTLQ